MTKYVFLDEAGNFDLGPSGSRWLMVVAVGLELVDARTAAIARLRYALNDEGLDIPGFHASANTPSTRNRFAELVQRHGSPSCIYACAVDKHRITSDADPESIYQGLVLGALRMAEADGHIGAVYADSIPLQRSRRAIHHAVSSALGRRRVRFHPSHAVAELQIADYACWALWRKITQQDERMWRCLGQPKVNITWLSEK
jgi:hypothetical protein